MSFHVYVPLYFVLPCVCPLRVHVISVGTLHQMVYTLPCVQYTPPCVHLIVYSLNHVNTQPYVSLTVCALNREYTQS